MLACFCLPPVHSSEPIPATACTSRATGAIELSVHDHSPLYAEVEHSPALSQRLADALAQEGFAVTADRAAAKAVLIFRGDIALTGGPSYSKGVKVGIGDAVEKSLQATKEGGEITRGDLVQAVAGLAINKAALGSALSPFWRSLALGNMVSVLGEATGFNAAANKTLAGDPRGVCLSRCDDWKKVTQTVYLWISLQTGESNKEIRVLTRAFPEVVSPETVLDRGLSDGLAAIRIVSSVELRPN